MNRPMSDFGPEKLGASAIDEILFGCGQYLIWHNEPQTVGKLSNQWNNWLLNQGFASVMHARVDGLKIIVELSNEGHTTLLTLGSTQRERQYLGAFMDEKTKWLAYFRGAIKALGI